MTSCLTKQEIYNKNVLQQFYLSSIDCSNFSSNMQVMSGWNLNVVNTKTFWVTWTLLKLNLDERLSL